MVGSKFKHSERFSISLNQFLPFVSQNLAVDFLAQYPHKYYNRAVRNLQIEMSLNC